MAMLLFGRVENFKDEDVVKGTFEQRLNSFFDDVNKSTVDYAKGIKKLPIGGFDYLKFYDITWGDMYISQKYGEDVTMEVLKTTKTNLELSEGLKYIIFDDSLILDYNLLCNLLKEKGIDMCLIEQNNQPVVQVSNSLTFGKAK